MIHPKNGAGLLSSTTDEISGYRLFDKDALIEVLLIQIAEEAGYSIKQIREMLKSMDLFSTIDSQIDELLAKQRELIEKIRVAQVVRLLLELSTDENQEEQEYESALLFGEFMTSLLSDFAHGLEKTLTTEEIKRIETAGLEIADEAINEYITCLLEYQTLTRKGVNQSQIKEKAKELDTLAEKISKESGPKIERALENYSSTRLSGVLPTSKEAIKAVKDLLKASFPVLVFLPTPIFEKAMKSLLEARRTATLLELCVGEGTVDYFEKSVEAYILCRKAKEKYNGQRK